MPTLYDAGPARGRNNASTPHMQSVNFYRDTSSQKEWVYLCVWVCTRCVHKDTLNIYTSASPYLCMIWDANSANISSITELNPLMLLCEHFVWKINHTTVLNGEFQRTETRGKITAKAAYYMQLTLTQFFVHTLLSTQITTMKWNGWKSLWNSVWSSNSAKCPCLRCVVEWHQGLRWFTCKKWNQFWPSGWRFLLGNPPFLPSFPIACMV